MHVSSLEQLIVLLVFLKNSESCIKLKEILWFSSDGLGAINTSRESRKVS